MFSTARNVCNRPHGRPGSVGRKPWERQIVTQTRSISQFLFPQLLLARLFTSINLTQPLSFHHSEKFETNRSFKYSTSQGWNSINIHRSSVLTPGKRDDSTKQLSRNQNIGTPNDTKVEIQFFDLPKVEFPRKIKGNHLYLGWLGLTVSTTPRVMENIYDAMLLSSNERPTCLVYITGLLQLKRHIKIFIHK